MLERGLDYPGFQGKNLIILKSMGSCFFSIDFHDAIISPAVFLFVSRKWRQNTFGKTNSRMSFITKFLVGLREVGGDLLEIFWCPQAVGLWL